MGDERSLLDIAQCQAAALGEGGEPGWERDGVVSEDTLS